MDTRTDRIFKDILEARSDWTTSDENRDDAIMDIHRELFEGNKDPHNHAGDITWQHH